MTQKKGIPVFIYIAGVALIASAVRLFQYLVLFDFETGFYISGGEKGALICRLALLAALIALLVLCVVGKRKGWTAFTVSSDGLGDRASLYLGIIYLVCAVLSAWEIFAGEDAVLTAVSAVQTAVLTVTGLLMLKNKVIPVPAGYTQMLLSVCFLIRAVVCFDSDLVIRSRSDLLIVLLAYVFGAMLATATARCYARQELKSSRSREIAAAALAFIFSALNIFPKLLAYLFGGTAAAGMEPPDRNAVCLLLISAGFLCVLFFSTQRKSIVYLLSDEDKKKAKKNGAENDNKEDEKTGEA